MTPDDSARWIDLLCALRAEHLERLHAFGRRVATGALALAGSLVFGSLLSLDALWDLSFYDSELGFTLAVAAAAALVAACGLIALALHQQRRDRVAAIALLDRAVPRLVAGADPKVVLDELSERMRPLASARRDADPSPHLPSVLDARWLGTTAYTKTALACALLVLASLLLASALALSVPPADEEFDGDTPTASFTSAGAR